MKFKQVITRSLTLFATLSWIDLVASPLFPSSHPPSRSVRLPKLLVYEAFSNY
jgi:hypothetical protein